MTAEAQKAQVFAFIDAINRLAWDDLGDLCTDSVSYHVRPASLGGFGKPDGYDKEGLKGLLRRLTARYINFFNLGAPLELIQSENKAFFWVRADGKAQDDELYDNEFMVILYFEPGKAKIVKIVEMMDSAFAKALGGRIEAKLEAKK